MLDEKGFYLHITQKCMGAPGLGWMETSTNFIASGTDKLSLMAQLDAVLRGFCTANLPLDLHLLLYVDIFINRVHGSTKSH